MKSTERKKKNEWQRVDSGQPIKDGLYSIKLFDGRVFHNVEYAEGVFWKMRKGSSGHTWTVLEYRKEA